jgi:hypothetical protein
MFGLLGLEGFPPWWGLTEFFAASATKMFPTRQHPQKLTREESPKVHQNNSGRGEPGLIHAGLQFCGGGCNGNIDADVCSSGVTGVWRAGGLWNLSRNVPYLPCSRDRRSQNASLHSHRPDGHRKLAFQLRSTRKKRPSKPLFLRSILYALHAASSTAAVYSAFSAPVPAAVPSVADKSAPA